MNIPATTATKLPYWIYPEIWPVDGADLAIDLIFTDQRAMEYPVVPAGKERTHA